MRVEQVIWTCAMAVLVGATISASASGPYLALDIAVGVASLAGPTRRPSRFPSPTVKAHVTHILTKAGLANRTQIALLAHDAGLA